MLRFQPQSCKQCFPGFFGTAGHPVCWTETNNSRSAYKPNGGADLLDLIYSSHRRSLNALFGQLCIIFRGRRWGCFWAENDFPTDATEWKLLFSCAFALTFHRVLRRASPVCSVLPAAAGRGDLWHGHGDSGPDTHRYLLRQHHRVVSPPSATHLVKNTGKFHSARRWHWGCFHPFAVVKPARVLSCASSCTVAARRTTTQQGARRGN